MKAKLVGLLVVGFVVAVGAITVIESSGSLENDDIGVADSLSKPGYGKTPLQEDDRLSNQLFESYPRSTQAELDEARKAVGLNIDRDLVDNNPRSSSRELDEALKAVGLKGQFEEGSTEHYARSTHEELEEAVRALSENNPLVLTESSIARQTRSSQQELDAAVMALAASEGLSISLDEQSYPRSSEEELDAAVKATLNIAE